MLKGEDPAQDLGVYQQSQEGEKSGSQGNKEQGSMSGEKKTALFRMILPGIFQEIKGGDANQKGRVGH